MKVYNFHANWYIKYGISTITTAILLLLYCLLYTVKVEQTLNLDLIRIDSVLFIGVITSTEEHPFKQPDTLHLLLGKEQVTFKVEKYNFASQTLHLILVNKNNFTTYQKISTEIPLGKIKMWDLLFKWK